MHVSVKHIKNLRLLLTYEAQIQSQAKYLLTPITLTSDCFASMTKPLLKQLLHLDSEDVNSRECPHTHLVHRAAILAAIKDWTQLSVQQQMHAFWDVQDLFSDYQANLKRNRQTHMTESQIDCEANNLVVRMYKVNHHFRKVQHISDAKYHACLDCLGIACKYYDPEDFAFVCS
ncbi:hypothetical protein HDU77_011741 [Chytriomyces hyalinus]|nr:hypothetical protein HDU77_011741 [Chytriomyces hyalinus]